MKVNQANFYQQLVFIKSDYYKAQEKIKTVMTELGKVLIKIEYNNETELQEIIEWTKPQEITEVLKELFTTTREQLKNIQEIGKLLDKNNYELDKLIDLISPTD